MSVKPSNLLINAPPKIAKSQNYLTVKNFAVSQWNCSAYKLSSKHERRLGEFEKVMQIRDAVEGSYNFQEIFQPPSVLMRECKHRKEVFYCLNSNWLPTKFSRHICSVRRRTIYYSTTTQNTCSQIKNLMYYKHISPITLLKKVNVVYF